MSDAPKPITVELQSLKQLPTKQLVSIIEQQQAGKSATTSDDWAVAARDRTDLGESADQQSDLLKAAVYRATDEIRKA